MLADRRERARLDHCVLPVESLEAARARYSAAGFTVAPDGIHPFGTANCCIYFADGTFLEPLAVADPQVARQAGAAGNVFVGRDQTFRRQQAEGMSALVIASDDAAVDDRHFRSKGFGAGDRLSFSRAVIDAAGRQDTAGFELAFAAPGHEGAFAFSCQRLAQPAIDRSGLQRHDNGVVGISEIVAVADVPEHQRAFLETVLCVEVKAIARELFFDMGGWRVSVVRPQTFAGRFGVEAPTAGRLSYGAIVFQASPTRLAEWVGTWGLKLTAGDGLTVLPPAAGQGVVLAFSSA